MAVDAQRFRAISRRQNSVLTWAQLLDVGFTPAAIRHRVERQRFWHLVFQVYSVADPALIPLARPTAALISIGDDAALSYRSAAALWQMVSSPPEIVHVVVARRGVRPRPRAHIHHVAHLHPADTTTRHHLLDQ